MEVLREIAAAAIEHPLRPFWVGTVLVSLLVQVLKVASSSLALREHKYVSRGLPLAAPVIGMLLFGVYPSAFAIDRLLDAESLGGRSLHSIGAVLGVGVGYAAMGLYEGVIEIVEEWSPKTAEKMRAKSRSEASGDQQ